MFACAAAGLLLRSSWGHVDDIPAKEIIHPDMAYAGSPIAVMYLL
jgi:hypothetical protein